MELLPILAMFSLAFGWGESLQDLLGDDDSEGTDDEDSQSCSLGWMWCDAESQCLKVWETCVDDTEDQEDANDEDSTSCSFGYTWCDAQSECLSILDECVDGTEDQEDANDEDSTSCSFGYTWCDAQSACLSILDECVDDDSLLTEDANEEDSTSCSFGYTWCDAQSECLGILEECVDDESLVGADEDEHGCIGSAGYLWCENLEDCVRPFELDGSWNDVCEVNASIPISANDSSSSDNGNWDILDEIDEFVNQSEIDTDDLDEALNQSGIDTDSNLGEGIDTENLLDNIDTDNLLDGNDDLEGLVDDVLQNLGEDEDEDGVSEEETSPQIDTSTSVDNSTLDEDCNKESSWCKGCSTNFFKTKIFMAIMIVTCLIASCLCWRLRRNRTRAKLATKLGILSESDDAQTTTKEGECLVETTARKEGESSGTETTTNPDINKLVTIV